MTSRSRLLLLGALIIVAAAALALWYTSEGQRRDRNVARLTDLDGVDGVHVDREGIDSLALDRDVNSDEMAAVLDALDDLGSPAVSDGTRVDVGWIATDVFDLPTVWESAVAAGDLPSRGHPLEARAFGSDVWIETRLGPGDRTGGLAPTSAEAARVVLPVLASLLENGVPDELELVVAESEPNEQDLIVVDRAALADVASTIDRLRRLALASPEGVIVCDADACRAG